MYSNFGSASVFKTSKDSFLNSSSFSSSSFSIIGFNLLSLSFLIPSTKDSNLVILKSLSFISVALPTSANFPSLPLFKNQEGSLLKVPPPKKSDSLAVYPSKFSGTFGSSFPQAVNPIIATKAKPIVFLSIRISFFILNVAVICLNKDKSFFFLIQ